MYCKETEISCELTAIINITKAVYGQYVCSNKTRVCHNITYSLQKVRGECQGRQRCSFKVSNGFIGEDPCYRFLKHLYVEYECVNKPGIFNRS